MARKILIFILSLTLFAGLVSADTPTPLTNEEIAAVSNIHNVFRRAVEIIKPAVVTVKLFHDTAYAGEENTGLGSGFIISEDGYILTNNHVAEGNDRIAVILDDGRVFEVAETYLDPLTDLAVIKIDPKDEALPYAKFGDSEDAKVGDFVMAVGSPFGLTQTVTMGIISYKGRKTNILGTWGIEDFIQTDADINKGNSGGPLVNLYGEVIGINSNIFSPNGLSSGYGFAVPSNIANYVSKELIANKSVKRGYLGVKLYGKPLTELKVASDEEILVIAEGKLDEASQLKNLFQSIPDDLKGVFIVNVESGTPAAQGNMESYDIIVSYNGHKPDDSSELRQLIALEKPDTEVTFEVWRNGQLVNLSVTLSDRDNAIAQIEKQNKELLAQRIQNNGRFPFQLSPKNIIPFADQLPEDKPKLGIKVEQLSPFLAKQYGYPGVTGQLKQVIITGVTLGSLAEKYGINEGDIITKVNGNKVYNPTQLKEYIQNSNMDQGVELTLKNSKGESVITVTNTNNSF